MSEPGFILCCLLTDLTSSSWPETIPASRVQKVVAMLAFLVHTGVFPTCAGWRGKAASAWSRARIVWRDRTQSSRTERVRGVKRCGNEESIVTENFYIYIYIYMNIYINWQILRWLELSAEVLIFFFFLFRITLCRAFYSEKTCMYFWLVFGKLLLPGWEGRKW